MEFWQGHHHPLTPGKNYRRGNETESFLHIGLERELRSKPSKTAREKGLGRLARGVPLEQAGEWGEVESELSFKAVVCRTYESLLQRCMATFEVWASRRREICEAESRNEESGAELLRLQADYTMSYNDLCKHVGRCEICRLFSFTYHGNGAEDSNLLYVRDLPTKTERPRAR